MPLLLVIKASLYKKIHQFFIDSELIPVCFDAENLFSVKAL